MNHDCAQDRIQNSLAKKKPPTKKKKKKKQNREFGFELLLLQSTSCLQFESNHILQLLSCSVVPDFLWLYGS